MTSQLTRCYVEALVLLALVLAKGSFEKRHRVTAGRIKSLKEN
jgi:hypothetical protein